MSISSKLFRSAMLSCLTFVGAGIGRAEDIKTPPQSQLLSAQLKWRVEIISRSHAELPTESTVDIGPRMASPVPGYDQIEISYIANGVRSKPVDVLLSKDGSKMAQFQDSLSCSPRQIRQSSPCRVPRHALRKASVGGQSSG
jgi:hypothetical protein